MSVGLDRGGGVMTDEVIMEYIRVEEVIEPSDGGYNFSVSNL